MTGRLIRENGLVPKKGKGQNFLIDGRVADRHVGYADIQDGDRVLEVGPGFGILTKRLVDACDDVTCIEIDDILAGYIAENFSDVRLVKGDAVKVDFPQFDRFVSNLPYSVSTPIIFKLLTYDFKKAVVMVQREFAERMVADTGSLDYSRLTVNLFYKADCRILENVPRTRFKPQPRVDSSIVEIVPREPPFKVLDEDMFFKVTEVTFNHRRKQIGTSLKASGLVDSLDGIPFCNERVEHLTPSEIGEIADAVHIHCKT